MSKRDERLFLQDISDAVDAIIEYTENINVESFSTNRLVYSATIREFEIIGEATIHLSIELLNQYDVIPWQDLKDFRNLLIHEYFGVDYEIIWNTIKNDIPQLKVVIEQMLLESKKS